MTETGPPTPRAVAETETEPGAPRAVAERKAEPDRRWVSAESFLETLDPEREAPAHRDYLSNRGKPGPWVRS